VASLQVKVKLALDESRILILGAQVLLGFQFRAFFEEGWGRLSPAARWCELAALFALLASVGALCLPVARHRIVERGNDTAHFHRFTLRVVTFALLPFAVGLMLDLGVAGDVVLGPRGGVAMGVGTGTAALTLWYGHFARPHRKKQGKEAEMTRTSLEERIIEVLTEARVVLPGAQALLGFQLAMVLMEPFERLPRMAQVVHLASLGFVALATIVLMAPPAYHRIVERGEDTERFYTFASRILLVALVLLVPGFAGDVYVVLVRVGLDRAAVPAAVATLLAFYATWFGAMLIKRALVARGSAASPGPTPDRAR
jgi:hypothetical protein